MSIETLENAKVALMLDKETVFYSCLLLELDTMYSPDFPTAATNGKRIMVNEVWFESLTKGQRTFLLCHEVLHVAFMHMARIDDRDPKIWNIACDLAINYHLVEECGMEFIPGGCLDKEYAGMSAEEIYDQLIEDGDDLPELDMDDIIINGDLNQAEITNIVVRAYQNASLGNNGKSPGNMPGSLIRMIEDILFPKLPWTTLLERYKDSKREEDYSWMEREFIFTGAYIPTLDGETIAKVCIYVDESCSVSDEDNAQYCAEIMAIKRDLNPLVMEIVSFDTEIQHIQTIVESDEPEIEFKGGGGTDLTDVAERINKERAPVNILFTDGYYRPVDYDVEVLHIIIGNPNYTNDQNQPVIHVDQ